MTPTRTTLRFFSIRIVFLICCITGNIDAQGGPPLTGLRLWLEADAGITQDESGNIAVWQDQSGFRNDATQSSSAAQPSLTTNAINGLPAVYFDGNHRFFTLPGFMTGATAAELFVLLKTEGDQNIAHGFMRFGSGGQSIGTGTDIMYPCLGRIFDAFGSTTVKDLGVPSLALTEFHLYDATSQAGEWTARINGELQFRTTSNVAGFATDPTIGALYFNFQGKMAEILVYDRVLTDEDREAVGVYLNNKYDLILAPPATPTAVTLGPLSPTQMSLRWTSSPSTCSTIYTVERSVNQDSFVSIAELIDSTSYIDSGLTAGASYFYRIIARNFAGSSSYSDSVTASTLTAGNAFPVDGIRLWLKGDSGAVHSVSGQIRLWQDQSSQAANGQQIEVISEPVLADSSANGRPTVYFDGNHRFFTLPASLTGASEGELFVVLKTEGDENLPHGFMRLGSGGQSIGLGTDILYPYLGHIDDAFGSTTVKDIGVPSQPLGEFHLYNAASQSGDWKARINGSLQYTTSDNVVGFAADPTIGALYYSFQGNMAEIIVYDRILSDSERERVQWYLADKYFIGGYDLDYDGLTNSEEQSLGSDPYISDTNGDGISDGIAIQVGLSVTNPDLDNDGLANGLEYSLGTNPFAADSDGDGVIDGQDDYPLDPSRSQAPGSDPNDHTAPIITLNEPVGAILIP